jgi:ethanolamine ammonia-lyase large subunit
MSALLTPLPNILVPAPGPDETYALQVAGRDFRFHGLKRLLGAADYSKAGDRNAGLAAQSEVEREAARAILSDLTLQHLFDRPLCDGEGRVDDVMRVNYDIDHAIFAPLAHLSVGELKDRLLAAPSAEVTTIGRGLTGVMAAAVAKILDVHELVYLAAKIRRPTRARTHLGTAGTLSSRLQPNHPSDDPRGILLLLYSGLAMASGDALLGINPAVDTVENVTALLRLLHTVRERFAVPTQCCVLSHVKTQLACLEAGVPVEILFQSLAGTERTNLTEFDITVGLLDAAYRRMAERGALRGIAEQFTYFETGQGSEFTYGKHNGIDMTTAEALCYGLARRWDPFMVNNVTGFIGPETHLDNVEMIVSNLQDHFMGKLLGLPMGMAPCYTLHSHITLDGQQLATQLLTAAGANYYMDVHLNTDRMLAYFDTSGHDDQTLREIHRRSTTPEYRAWAVERGILAADGISRGERWGDPRLFCDSAAELAGLTRYTPALHGFTSAGPRPENRSERAVRLQQALAREAIYADLDLEALAALAPFRVVRTRAGSKAAHLNSPALGAALDPASEQTLGREGNQVQIVVSDGLSAKAVHANLPDLWPVLSDGFRRKNVRTGAPIAVPYGRVKLAEPLAEALDAALTILLIGERPGGDADAATSLSAYFVYRLADPAAQAAAAQSSGHPDIRFEYTVLSNIYGKGLPPTEAGSVIVERALQILEHRAAGNRLESLLS